MPSNALTAEESERGGWSGARPTTSRRGHARRCWRSRPSPRRFTITIDKLAGSFLPQALSARIFGFHQWSLTLPQVIEGVISVLVMHRVVRRWAGPVPAVLAAGLFTLTPVVASMFGHPMEDGALTMCLVLAADSYAVSVRDVRVIGQTGPDRWE
jgi:hypothetical protein